MKKLRAVLAALLLFTSASAFADDFDWSQCWCNYGAEIEAGDMLLAVDGGIPWDIFDAFNSGGWTIPYVLADFGYTIGASWYFTELFGANLELGFPMNRIGVVFQF